MRMPSKSLMRLRRLWDTNPQSVKIPKTPDFQVGRFFWCLDPRYSVSKTVNVENREWRSKSRQFGLKGLLCEKINPYDPNKKKRSSLLRFFGIVRIGGF